MFTHLFSQLGPSFYSPTHIQPLKGQRLVECNKPLAKSLGLDLIDPRLQSFLNGETPLPQSLSMVYAGHQFGGYSPQLGDGRGVLLGEVMTQEGPIDLHMKGAGPTPYSRRGDGRAVLRSCIREYLASEYLHALGVPTSRALCLYDSDTLVYRERPEKGAMLLRTAKSHIRFGHFEYFFHQNKPQELKALIDFCLTHYYSDCLNDEKPIKSMLLKVVTRTAKMIAQWQIIGFQHGVMNTDNMSFVGETIDYGPYGFMDAYDPTWIANHSDYDGRYAFHRQPSIGLWNLNCLMHAFSGYVDRDDLVAVLSQYDHIFKGAYARLLKAKLGLDQSTVLDESFVSDLFSLLRKEKMDYGLFFRYLSEIETPEDVTILVDSFVDRDALMGWYDTYTTYRLKQEVSWHESHIQMLNVNPKYILRNYLAQQVIEAAEQNNYLPFRRLLHVLETPFETHLGCEELAQRPPDWAQDIEVSCSS